MCSVLTMARSSSTSSLVKLLRNACWSSSSSWPSPRTFVAAACIYEYISAALGST